jgi:hypothetical protein
VKELSPKFGGVYRTETRTSSCSLPRASSSASVLRGLSPSQQTAPIEEWQAFSHDEDDEQHQGRDILFGNMNSTLPVYVCLHLCVCVCIHTHTCMCIHTHTHTLSHTHSLMNVLQLYEHLHQEFCAGIRKTNEASALDKERLMGLSTEGPWWAHTHMHAQSCTSQRRDERNLRLRGQGGVDISGTSTSRVSPYNLDLECSDSTLEALPMSERFVIFYAT